jgi:hypothetical protein
LFVSRHYAFNEVALARYRVRVQWEMILHNHDDRDREAGARLFYEANREAMAE